MALNGFDGNGNFLRTFPEGGWKGDATAGIKIRADRHDDHDQAMANALSNMICKDGQTTILADIPFNGKKITGLGTPTAPTDGVNKAYADSVKTFTTGTEISGADLNGRLTFTSPTGANGIAWTGADLSWIARLTVAAGPGTPPNPLPYPNRLALNNKADGTGTDVFWISEDGRLTAMVNDYAVNAYYDGTTWRVADGGWGFVMSHGITTGAYNFFNSGATTLAAGTAMPLTRLFGSDVSGNFSAKGNITSDAGNFVGNTGGGVVLAPGVPGSVYLRPNGAGSSSAQWTIDSAGNVTQGSGAYNMNGSFTAQGNVAAGSNLYATSGGMVFGAGGAGRIMQFSPNWYWDWNISNGNLNYRASGGGSWIQLDGQLTIPANAYKPGGGSWLNGSDARIKDVQGDYADGLDKLLGLQPKIYQLKGNDQPPEGGMAVLSLDRSYVGLIAQEAETVMPSLVGQRPGWIDGQEVSDFRVIDTSELTFTLINAVKDLKALLDEANARIAALEAAP